MDTPIVGYNENMVLSNTLFIRFLRNLIELDGLSTILLYVQLKQQKRSVCILILIIMHLWIDIFKTKIKEI